MLPVALNQWLSNFFMLRRTTKLLKNSLRTSWKNKAEAAVTLRKNKKIAILVLISTLNLTQTLTLALILALILTLCRGSRKGGQGGTCPPSNLRCLNLQNKSNMPIQTKKATLCGAFSLFLPWCSGRGQEKQDSHW